MRLNKRLLKWIWRAASYEEGERPRRRWSRNIETKKKHSSLEIVLNLPLWFKANYKYVHISLGFKKTCPSLSHTLVIHNLSGSLALSSFHVVFSFEIFACTEKLPTKFFLFPPDNFLAFLFFSRTSVLAEFICLEASRWLILNPNGRISAYRTIKIIAKIKNKHSIQMQIFDGILWFSWMHQNGWLWDVYCFTFFAVVKV